MSPARTACAPCSDAHRRGKYEDHLPSVVYYAPIAMPGHPTLQGHRLGAEMIADLAWSQGIAETMKDYRLSRAEVLVCCWWAGRWGPRRFKAAWKEWATEAGWHLWYSCVRVDDPPRKVPA